MRVDTIMATQALATFASHAAAFTGRRHAQLCRRMLLLSATGTPLAQLIPTGGIAGRYYAHDTDVAGITHGFHFIIQPQLLIFRRRCRPFSKVKSILTLLLDGHASLHYWSRSTQCRHEIPIYIL